MATNDRWRRLQQLILQYGQVHAQQGYVDGLLRKQLFATLHEVFEECATREAYRNSAGRNERWTADEVVNRLWAKKRFTEYALSYDPNKDSSAYTYFRTVVRNAWVDWLRINKHMRPFEPNCTAGEEFESDEDLDLVMERIDSRLSDLPESGDLTQQEIAWAKARLEADVKAACSSLDKRQERAFRAIAEEEITQVEFAKREGISVATVKRDFLKAKDQLAKLMASHGTVGR